MGYSTDFSGELKFTTDLTAKQLGKLNSFLGEDCRDHPEWKIQNTETKFLTYINIELTKDFSGIKWDGSEKTNEMVEIVNVIIELMRREYPEFGLTGKLLAQGEDIEDRWWLQIVEGKAIGVPIELTDKKIRCPHCDKVFIIETEVSSFENLINETD